MEFESLLCKNGYSERKTDMQVFEDIKLTSLLPNNVLEIMSSFATKEDIALRREIFENLTADRAAQMRKLRDICAKLKSCFASLDAADSEYEKYYIFASLLHTYCSFCKVSAELSGEEFLLKRYSQSFIQLCNSDFCCMRDEVNELCGKITRKFVFHTEQNRITFSKEKESGIAARIIKSAEKMGITAEENKEYGRHLNKTSYDCIAKLYPDEFESLKTVFEKYKAYPRKELLEYIDEFDFYLSFNELQSRVKKANIPTCYPNICEEKRINIASSYDITLLTKDCDQVIPNDICFDSERRFFFLVGANGGGKTTYLRNTAIGVILALNGCFVPAVSASLCELKAVMTHFPSDERFDSQGRFFDEQSRVDRIIAEADEDTLILLNETYSTTNEAKAREKTTELSGIISNKASFSIFVTHQKSVFDTKLPVLSCVIDEKDNNRRTYKIKPIDSVGGSFARDILAKYNLSEDGLSERFGI